MMIYFKYFQDIISSNGRMYSFTASGLKVPSHTENLTFLFMHLRVSPVIRDLTKSPYNCLFCF